MNILCPHCGEEISKAYVNRSLDMLSKAEDESSTTSDGAVTGPTDYAGNKTDSHRGPHKPGKIHTSVRSKGEPVQRKNTPTNYASEEGMAEKGLRLPVIAGQPQAVEYSYGVDNLIAKSIADGTNHVPPMRNLQAEQDLFRSENNE